MARIGQRTFQAFIGILIAVALAVFAPLLGGTQQAYAEPTAADKQAEAQATLASLNAMQATLDKASNDYFAALEQQQQAEADRDAAQARIDEASDQIADLQERLSERARNMYRSGSTSVLDLLLGSITFQAFATNWDLLNQINESDSQLVQQTKDLRAEVESEKAVYAEQARVAEEKATEAKRIEEEAQATVATMQATYDSLSAEAAELLEQERAAQEAAQAAAALAAIEAQNNPDPSGPTDGPSPSPTPNTPSYTEPSYDSATGNAIVDRAWGWVGRAEYAWGACSPGAFDCSGFVSYCLTGSYSRLGTTYTFMGWRQVYDPQPGDVCVNEGHCGIYIGNGQMIHAATEGVGVIVGGVQGGMIYVRY